MSYTTITRISGFPQPTDGANGNLSITGRTLTHYNVILANVGVNPYAVGSNYDLLVKAISQVGSIELLGDPTGPAGNVNIFRVAISGAAPAAISGAYSLQGYCNTAVNGSGVLNTYVNTFTY
jgi:hypothetical protein